jgi:hypothetical protein
MSCTALSNCVGFLIYFHILLSEIR